MAEEIIFSVQESPEGGYEAKALPAPIFTEAGSGRVFVAAPHRRRRSSARRAVGLTSARSRRVATGHRWRPRATSPMIADRAAPHCALRSSGYLARNTTSTRDRSKSACTVQLDRPIRVAHRRRGFDGHDGAGRVHRHVAGV